MHTGPPGSLSWYSVYGLWGAEAFPGAGTGRVSRTLEPLAHLLQCGSHETLCRPDLIRGLPHLPLACLRSETSTLRARERQAVSTGPCSAKGPVTCEGGGTGIPSRDLGQVTQDLSGSWQKPESPPDSSPGENLRKSLFAKMWAEYWEHSQGQGVTWAGTAVPREPPSRRLDLGSGTKGLR